MRIVGWAFIVLLICGAAIAIDITYGRVSESSLTRQDALNFRNEAAYTLFSTKNIVPETDHAYRFPYRDEGEELLKITEPRRFRSNEVGAVEPSPAATEGATTIAFLGGSTTENNEVDEPFRFPGGVAEILKKDGMNAATLNFGVRGHTTIDSINVLINRHQDTKADYVVLMHNINDRFRSASDRGYTAVPGTERMSSLGAVSNAAQKLLGAVWDYVSYRSNILFSLRFNENINDAFRDDHGPEKDNAGNIIVPEGGRNKPDGAAFAKNLHVFVAAAHALGIEPLLMTQALGNRDEDHEAFNDIVREVASSENVGLIDLSAALGIEPHWAFLSDDIHFNNKGSIAAANVIAEVLAEKIWGQETGDVDVRPEIVALSELATHCPKGDGDLKPGKPWHLGGLRGRYPSVSADGKWLLFQERVGAADRMRLANLTNGNVHEIAPEEPNVSERHPAFIETTDRSVKIVYGRGAEDDNPAKVEQLIELTWPDMRRRVLTSPEISGSIPTASRGRIVFAGSKGAPPDLYDMTKGLTEPRQLTDTDWEEWRPVVSSSGDVYFISNEMGNFDIYRRSSDGVIDKVWGSPADEWDPALSSDGRYLAFASRVKGNWNLYTLPLKNSDERPIQLTSDDDDEWDPSFADHWNMLVYATADRRGPRLMGLCISEDN